MRAKILNFSHLQEQKITYSKHFARSAKISLSMLFGFIVGFLHAFLPFILWEYNTNNIKKMAKKIGLK